MDITISLTEKQFETITKILSAFSVNIKSDNPAPAVVPEKKLSAEEKVLKVLNKLWEKDIFVSYSDLMRSGHFTATELKPALVKLKTENKITFFECSEKATGKWPALYIGKCFTTEQQAERQEKKFEKSNAKKKIVRHKIPCFLVHEETGETKYFQCMNDAWRFLGVGRGNFRPSAKSVVGFVYNGWKFDFPEDGNA